MCDSIAEGGERCPSHSGLGRYYADLARRVYGSSNATTRALVAKHAVPGAALSKLRGERGALAARTEDREEMEILLKDTSYQVRWALAGNDSFRQHADLVARLQSAEKRQEVLDALAGGTAKPIVASQTREWRREPEEDVPVSAYAALLQQYGPSNTWTADVLDAVVEIAKQDPSTLKAFTVADQVAMMSKYSPRPVDDLLMEHRGTSTELLAAAWARSKYESTRALVLLHADPYGLAHLMQSEDRELQVLVADRLHQRGFIQNQPEVDDPDSPKTLAALEEATSVALLISATKK